VPCEAEKEFAFPHFDILMVHSLKAYSKYRYGEVLLYVQELKNQSFILTAVRAQPAILTSSNPGPTSANDQNLVGTCLLVHFGNDNTCPESRTIGLSIVYDCLLIIAPVWSLWHGWLNKSSAQIFNLEHCNHGLRAFNSDRLG